MNRFHDVTTDRNDAYDRVGAHIGLMPILCMSQSGDPNRLVPPFDEGPGRDNPDPGNDGEPVRQ